MLSALLCGFILFSKCGLVSLFMNIVGPFFCIDMLRVRIQVILLSVCCEVSDSICVLLCLVTEARDCQRDTCAFTTKLVIQDFRREKDNAASIVTVRVCTQDMGLGFAFIFRLLATSDRLWESSRAQRACRLRWAEEFMQGKPFLWEGVHSSQLKACPSLCTCVWLWATDVVSTPQCDVIIQRCLYISICFDTLFNTATSSCLHNLDCETGGAQLFELM